MLVKISPCTRLEEFVEYYWFEQREQVRDKVLPDGKMTWVFFPEKLAKLIDHDGKNITCHRSMVIGPRKTFYFVINKDERKTIGIKFRIGRAYYFINKPVSYYAERFSDLNEILGDKADEVLEDLGRVGCNVEIIKGILDNLLSVMLNEGKEINKIVENSLDRISINGFPSLISQLTGTLNISHNHLIRLFNQYVGLSPKVVYRINKFRSAIDMINNEKRSSWPDIALSCNYYDQAHFINEFRCFTGISPKRFQEENGVFVND